MKTEQEIRARIAELEADITEEAERGHEGGDDWWGDVLRLQELRWVLGEE